MKLQQLLESIENRILEATGALAAFVGEINGSTAELRLRFYSLMDLDHIHRALTNLKRLLRSYGLIVRKPRLEAIQDSLELVVEIVEAKTADLYHT